MYCRSQLIDATSWLVITYWVTLSQLYRALVTAKADKNTQGLLLDRGHRMKKGKAQSTDDMTFTNALCGVRI